ncbi:MFS transporter [Pseudomonas sp. NPDC088429]|uniref:MFS transporter n=1 Tax=Pseudomonas sp. NPDC088429 TaxID=3364455 RepID=UPI0037FD0D3B
MTIAEKVPQISLPHLLTYRLTFLLSGMSMGAWAPLVPYARIRTGIEHGELGLLLLCFGLGSMITMPFAGMLTAKKGVRFAMLLSAGIVCLTLPLLATLSSFVALAVVLALFGTGVGAADVAMNVQGVIVERDRGRPMMSGFHGLFSLGAIFSAALISALLWVGASPLQAALAVVVIIGSTILRHASRILNYGADEGGPLIARPTGNVLAIGMLCFIAFLVEGAMLDWSAVFLTTMHNVEPALAGIAYAGFALAMAIGRLNGDRLQAYYGGRRVLIWGSVLVVIGIAIAVLLDYWLLYLMGFVLVGFGLSNTVPVYCSLIGSQTAMPVGLAISTVTTIGYSGILLGPALIGFVAHASTLRTAFLGVAALVLILLVTARGITSTASR